MNKKKAEAAEGTNLFRTADTTPQTPPVPHLTDAEKNKLLLLQRSALVAEKALQQYDRAIKELNAAYQATIGAHPGYVFNVDTLEFSAKGE